MTIGIIGGCGRLGSALGARLANAGVAVLLGTRSVENNTTTPLSQVWGASIDEHLKIVDNLTAASASLVILAVPPQVALDVVEEFSEELAYKAIVSAVNTSLDETQSVAKRIQTRLPHALVSTAFNHLPARRLADPKFILDADVLISASVEAALPVRELVSHIEGLRPVYCGDLDLALTIEKFAYVLMGAGKNGGLASPSIRLTETLR